MDPNFLDFEQPIAELEAKIAELRHVGSDNAIDLAEEVERLETRLEEETQAIFSSLSSWQIAQLSRHPNRPYTMDYVRRLMSDFYELHGDRSYADDQAIVGGLAKFEDKRVVVIGHQKGRDTKQKVRRNFGMPRPEGYRKALRLMRLAERFELPVLTFIDTPGAYPGIGAEERGQSEAIARNLAEMSQLATPVICTIIGEGGSGGALAIGVGDKTLMLEYAMYSVISPEGCASILWKNADYAKDAASALGISSRTLKRLKLIDKVVPEPLGGAHRDHDAAALKLKESLVQALEEVCAVPPPDRIQRRYERLLGFQACRDES